MTAERTCKQCGRSLPIAAFRTDICSRAGRTPCFTCRDCAALRRAARRAKPAPVRGHRRVCRLCGVDKPLCEYYVTNVGQRDTACKTCRVQRQAEHRRARREADPAWAASSRARNAERMARMRMERAMERLLASRQAGTADQ